MRVTAKISDSPAPTRNSDDAPARPFSSWTTKPEGFIARGIAGWNQAAAAEPALPGRWGRPLRGSAAGAPGVGSIRGARLLDQLSARLELRAVEILVVDHHALALVVLGLADERAHRRLVVVGAVRDLAERRVDLQAFEGLDELVGLAALRLLHASGDRLDRAVAHHRAE